MILILAFIAGAALGWLRAARRGGATADRVQYAFAHGFAALVAAAALALLLGLFGLSPL
ncbi:MAG: hypothetical protein ACFCUS_00870 [Rubrimonas sp.]|uniref:hypothetical protein n=1 Tax=Rubrimonas sp. TaxID=2036015 RepID=UPI002FDCC086